MKTRRNEEENKKEKSKEDQKGDTEEKTRKDDLKTITPRILKQKMYVQSNMP